MVPSLPLDVLVHILYQIPPSRDLDSISVRTLVQCSLTNTLFREAAAIPALWQQHYQVRYIHANEASEGQRKAETNGNWKLMYAARRMVDMEVLKHLDSIVMKRVGRYDHASALTKFLFDAWDVLEIEIGTVDPSEHLEIHEVGVAHSLSATRVYWASELLTSIGRTHAVGLWSSLRSDNNSVSFVQAFSSISCFFGKHPDEIHLLLSSLNYRCKDHLSRLNIPFSQADPKYDLKELCMHICDFMTTEGYRTVDPPNFHDLHNLLPHFYLTSHKRSIPLSLVHIFVSIAQSLGIAAFPFRLPLHVLVHITVPDPEVDDFFVDVFGVPTIINLRDDIPAILERQGIHGNSLMHYLSPSNTTTMLLRNGRFILSSLNLQRTSPSLELSSTLLAFTLFLVLTGTSQSVPHLMSQTDPLDCATFITEVLIPSLSNVREVQNDLRQASQQSLEEEALTAQEVRLRTPNTTVRYFVGMLFEHRSLRYTALITGWDPVMSKSWIRETEISDLPRGRDQPCYHVLCMDNSSRYVAEDNIKPLLSASDELLLQMCQGIRILPKLFTGVLMKTTTRSSNVRDAPVQYRRARFVLSPELATAYPEDDTMGDAWLGGGESVYTWLAGKELVLAAK
ncbi:uncharacterized protein C8R40DRAFT_1075859 [Lentinula edodes]|uniref:uncharacterized protein n=1 Tax=Lentinula edodes TaxID=5353 RepID=UPI001E8DFB9D|nr:uncharacterized protein C8R40DRAFT_1075859 [Lentinula edodes]KAH7880933.1 hypothetical protein C8R40DRAFT_1075859 [Lentinula edodes]